MAQAADEQSGAPSSAVSPARARILEAAERVVADVGAARLTLDVVAQSAGVSKGGLLYHFPSKESLLSALAQRYVDSMEHCVDAAKNDLAAETPSRNLKACVVGILGRDPRSKAMGAALFATAANDLTLLEVIRECIAKCTNELAQDQELNFARAAVVSLAVDGLMMRESLRISAYSDEQRELIVKELMQLADEAHVGAGGKNEQRSKSR
jgi:AcrR family transcriptional regulator